MSAVMFTALAHAEVLKTWAGERLCHRYLNSCSLHELGALCTESICTLNSGQFHSPRLAQCTLKVLNASYPR